MSDTLESACLRSLARQFQGPTTNKRSRGKKQEAGGKRKEIRRRRRRSIRICVGVEQNYLQTDRNPQQLGRRSIRGHVLTRHQTVVALPLTESAIRVTRDPSQRETNNYSFHRMFSIHEMKWDKVVYR